MRRPNLTILIAARDAAGTIGRAVRSCQEESCEILLVDDHCCDDTVGQALAAAGSHLRVVSAPDPGGVALARQCGLDHLDTEYAAWLDADDEWLPGRAARLLAALGAGYDVATEAIDLHSADGRWLRRLAMPGFLRRPGASVRLFERNSLPGDSQVAFRSQAYQSLGYQTALCGGESFDILLRGVWQGMRFHYGMEVGYRMYAYQGSVSRNLERQRRHLATALRKFDYIGVRQRYQEAGYSDRIAYWGLGSFALFCNDPGSALDFIAKASPLSADSDEILEPDGPWPFPEGWRRNFALGTVLLMLGGETQAAIEHLLDAEAVRPTAEGANNLGIALWHAGMREKARHYFNLAQIRFPGYRDASLNLLQDIPSQITTHPLRYFASRSEY